MEREAQIRQTAAEWLRYNHPTCTQDMLVEAFRCGAEWADAHPLSPWISVKDKLPEDGQIIVSYITQTISGGGEKNVEHQMVVERYKGRFTCDRMEQQRMGGYMFDIVVKTTHWLPMPQLPEAL